MERDIQDVRTAVIKFLNANNTRDRLHARRLRHRSPRRALRRRRNRAADRAHPPAQARRLDGALRRPRRLPEWRRAARRPEDHAPLHRRRRHAQRADVLRHARPAEGVGRHASTRSATWSTRRAAAACSADQLQRMARSPAGRRSFPASVKELDKLYEKIQREIAARYSLGYVSTRHPHGRRVAEGRDQAEAPGPEGRQAPHPHRLFRPLPAGQPPLSPEPVSQSFSQPMVRSEV